MNRDLVKFIATFFWEAGAIKVSVEKPFKLVSGKYAPLYIDCRLLISYPIQRDVMTAYAQWVCNECELDADYIAGGATAGIPFAAWLADKMAKPFIYVRKKPKGYGTDSQLEGKIEAGKKVLLFEDLITDGQSKLGFIEGIRRAGCEVKDCLVIFDRLQGGDKTLRGVQVDLHALVTVDDCIRVGLDNRYLTPKEADIVNEYIGQVRPEIP